MNILTLNGRGAEFIEQEVFAQDGAGSFTQNLPVCLAVDGNTANGIAAIHPTAATGKSWAGVMRTSVAIGGYGNARCWGYQSSCFYSNFGSSVTVTAGDAVRPVTGTGLGLASTTAAVTILNVKYAVALATITLSATGYTAVLVRAL